MSFFEEMIVDTITINRLIPEHYTENSTLLLFHNLNHMLIQQVMIVTAVINTLKKPQFRILAGFQRPYLLLEQQ